jgi:TRAP-type C4-dicarboxylate transport system substrate-binding protein
MGEVFTAMQLGTIDGFESSGYGGNYATGLHECSKYMIEPAPHTSYGWAGSGVHAVNMDAWESLPSDLQNIVRVACQAHAFNNYVNCLEDDLVARQKLIDYGCEVCTIPSEEFDIIVDAASASIEEFAKINDDCARIVAVLHECLALYDTRVGFAGFFA